MKAIAHYKVLDRLGSGGMGEVYLAEDRRLGRKVALKVLGAGFTKDENRLRRFELEARAASALNHPNIVTIYEIGESESGRFISMEFIDGLTLRAILTQQQPVLEQVVGWIKQVAEALDVAHSAGIVHRDIKPENIMVRDDGYLKVLDFGLVRLMPLGAPQSAADTQSTADFTQREPELSQSGVVLGTASYMSPEQARGESVSSPSDMFSLGILLYELATCKHPFAAESGLGYMHAIISKSPLYPSRLNPEISTDMEALILRLLEKEPRLRPSAADLRTMLASMDDNVRGAVTGGPYFRGTDYNTVGREDEHEQLHASFDAAVAGRGLLLCVTGEPGIGKTTLVEEFLSGLRADKRQCYIAQGRCSERLAGTEAYLPFLEALGGLLQKDTSISVARAMKTLAPTWYVQLAPVASGDSSAERLLADAQAASQERMKRELGVLLGEISRLHPLILFFEDLHWSDVATVELLAYVANKLDSMRVLIVVTFRKSELLLAKHPFLQIQLDLQMRNLCHEIPLEFLGRAEIEEYIAMAFPEHRFPSELITLVHAKTEGNPLFMVDLMRYLRDRGVIAKENGCWELAHQIPDVQQDLPESVRSMIQRKVDQLDDHDRRLLMTASVQGHEFDAAVLAQVLQMDAADVEEDLERLDRVHSLVRLVREHEFFDSTFTVRYRFVHALYQNAFYSSLSPTRRISYCSAVAECLLRFYNGQNDPIVSELAFLFEAARQFDRASDFFLQAATHAARIYANEEAIELSHRSVANAEKLQGDEQSIRTLAAALLAGRLHQTLTQYEEAIERFEFAEAVAGECENSEAQVEAICGKATSLFFLKRVQETLEAGTRAMDLATAIPSRSGIAAANAVLALERMGVGEIDEAEQRFECAINTFQDEGKTVQAMDAVAYSILLDSWRLEYARVEERSKWWLEKARALGVHVVQTLFFRGMALGNQGRMSEAISTLEEGVHLAELNDDRYHIPRLPNTLGWVHRELQDPETALRLDGESAKLARELGFEEAEANAHVNLATDYLTLGEHSSAIEHLQEAARIFKEDVWFRWRYNIRLQAEEASYWIARGDLNMAESCAVASLQLAEHSLARKHIAWAHKLLGDIAVLEDRGVDARNEFNFALGALRDHPCPTIEWKILKAAADLACSMKDLDTANKLLGSANVVVKSLAATVSDGRLRQGFLASKPIRELREAL